METISSFIKLFRQDPITTSCGTVFAISYYIVNNPDSISFLGEQALIFIVKICEFLRGASVSIGLLFATQAKPEQK